MEHEFIHVLLAWATGLRVYSLKVEFNGNGLAMIETPQLVGGARPVLHTVRALFIGTLGVGMALMELLQKLSLE